MEQGIVGRISEGLFRYQGWPTVCSDENGVLYVGCSGHRIRHVCPFGKNIMYISRDGGKVWSCPTIINDTYLDDRDTGMVYLGDGKILMTYFNNNRELYFGEWSKNHLGKDTDPIALKMEEGLLEGWKLLPKEQAEAGSYARLSENYGLTWGERVRVPVSSPHGPAKLGDGRLIWLGRECNSKKYRSGSIMAFESRDDGKSWSFLSEIPEPADLAPCMFCEPHIAEMPDGKLLGVIRTEGWLPDKKHIFKVFSTFSEDGGLTWTMPEDLGVCGSPPHLLVHSSKAVILVYGRREAPFGQRAIISYDSGKTWGDEIILCDNGPDGDLGYPSTAELPDGSLITVYYQKPVGDKYCSIMYTKWNLPERK